MTEPNATSLSEVATPITPQSHPHVYLSGEMSGVPDYNYPTFREYARSLRTQGFQVTCPTELFSGDQTRPYAEYMRMNLRSVTQADAVALLPGWMESRGVRMETSVAEWIGIPTVSVVTLKPVTRCPCGRCDDARREGMTPSESRTFCPTLFILCPLCGNKRCPHATWHGNNCSGSNEPGQKGSGYESLAIPDPIDAAPLKEGLFVITPH